MSQRARLMLTLIAAIVPLVLLALGLLWRDSDAVQQHTADERVALARAGALTAGALVEGNITTLQTLAAELQGADALDRDEVEQRLSRMVGVNARWFALSLFGPDGKVIIGTQATAGDLDISDRQYFQEMLATDRPTVSDSIVGRVSGLPSVMLAVPIVLANGEQGGLVAAVPVQNLAQGLLLTLGLEGLRVSVVDGSGRTIIHPDPERVNTLEEQDRPEIVAARDGETGSLVGRRNGEETLVAYAPVAGSRWVVLVLEPTSSAFAPAQEILWQGVGLIAVAMAAVLAIGWILGGLISRSYAAEQQARSDADDARRTAEDSEQRYADLVDGLDGVVWEADANTLHFTFVSPAVEGVLGGDRDQWLVEHARWSDHIHPDDRANIVDRCLAETRARRDHSCEYRATRADGRVIWLADVIRVVTDGGGEPRLLRGIMIDITDRRQADEERARLLGAEQEARAEVEEALRSRDEFLSIASHELRNPVAGIKGTSQLIKRLADRGRLTEVARSDYMDTIVKTSDRLARLVDDLLDVSRLRGGRFQLRLAQVDITELIRDAAAFEALEGREVRLSGMDAPCVAEVDPDRVQQIVQNLLENAAKYSPSHTPVDVTLYRTADDVVVTVTDYGIGLPPDAERTLFTPFGRAANAVAANIPGMGLGLYVSRGLAQAHGGRLEVESPGEGQGSTFRLTLPLRQPSPPAPSTSQPQAPQPPPTQPPAPQAQNGSH